MKNFNLLNGVPQPVPAGDYNLKILIGGGGGTAALSFQVGTEGYDSIPEVNAVDTTLGTIRLPHCSVKATLTGDAQMYLSGIK